MSDPNQIFVRERVRAATRSTPLAPPQNALYTDAGASTGDPVETFQPLIAPGSTVGATGSRESIPDDTLLNTVIQSVRSQTTDVIAVSRSRTHIVYPMTGGLGMAQGLLGTLTNAQGATVTGVYNMVIEQAFVDAPLQTFAAARSDQESAFSTAARGALEWFIQLPVIRGDIGQTTACKIVFVRQDMSTITASWEYSVDTQSVDLTIMDGQQILTTATAALTNRFGVVMAPSTSTLEFYLEGSYVISVPVSGSDRFEMVALFEQHENTYENNSAAQFYAALTVDPVYFVEDYGASALERI